MKLKKLMLFGLIFLFIASCSEKEEEIKKIGAILPLTGEVATYGIEVKKGIELAYNKEKNKNIKILYEDDRGNPKDGVNAAYKLISNDKVPIIIGAVPSSVTLAIAPILESNKVVLISPASSSPKITYAGQFIFRNYPSDNYEGTEIANFAFRLGYSNFHVITINNDYGLGLNKVFCDEVKKLNGKIITNQNFNEASNDFRTILSNTIYATDNNEGFFIVGYGVELGKIIKQARELGINNQFFSTVNFLDENTLTSGGKSIEGTIFTAPSFDQNSNSKEVKVFIKNYKEAYNSSPNVWSAHGYDAFNLIKEATNNFNIWDPEDIKNNLLDIKDFPGVSGKTSFDENGDVIKDLSIMTVSNGEFIKYEK